MFAAIILLKYEKFGVEQLFKWEMENNFNGVMHSIFSKVEKDHGRIETRKDL